MAKKCKNVPALNGMQVLRMVQKGELEVYFLLSRCPVMMITKERKIYQKWLVKDKKGNFIQKSKQTYLNKGIFLFPKWQNVDVDKIKWYREQNINLSDLGIFRFNTDYSLLTYDQVDDLDCVSRLPNHVLGTYLEKHKDLPKDISAVYKDVIKVGKIIAITADRLKLIYVFYSELKKNLATKRKTLESIIAGYEKVNSYEKLYSRQIARSAFEKDYTVRRLRSIIAYCRSIKNRPVYKRLYYASRSLELAIKYIKGGNFVRAEARMKSALKNMEYPAVKPTN